MSLPPRPPSQGRLILRGMLLGALAGAVLAAATLLVLGMVATSSAQRAGVAVPETPTLVLTVTVAAALGAVGGMVVGLAVAIAVGTTASRGAVSAVRLRASLAALITTALVLIVLGGWLLHSDPGGRVALTTTLTLAAGPTAWLLTPWLVREQVGRG